MYDPTGIAVALFAKSRYIRALGPGRNRRFVHILPLDGGAPAARSRHRGAWGVQGARSLNSVAILFGSLSSFFSRTPILPYTARHFSRKTPTRCAAACTPAHRTAHRRSSPPLPRSPRSPRRRCPQQREGWRYRSNRTLCTSTAGDVRGMRHSGRQLPHTSWTAACREFKIFDF